MGFWNRTKEITSKEYADLSSKIIKLGTDVEMLKHQFEKLELRITISKRRQKVEDTEEYDEEDDSSPEQKQFMNELKAFEQMRRR